LFPIVENPNSVSTRRVNRKTTLAFGSALQFLIFASVLVVGCGAPGVPTPPSPPVPVAIADLAAQQAGDGAQLTFSVPGKTIAGDRLSSPPAIEILRGHAKPDGTPDLKSFRVVYTIPGALVSNYATKDVLQFTDPIPPVETKAHAGALVAYRVRTRVSEKRASADSNTVLVRIFPVPERISSIEVRVTESAIELNWPAPSRTAAGDAITVSGYRVYRGELDPASSVGTTEELSQAKWRARPALLASPDANGYRDTSFEFGKTYLYVVRSAILVENNPLESSDSAPSVVAPLDTFPPAAPQGVVAAVLTGDTPGSLVIDLSWSINLENDLAGYRIYRSEQQDSRGQPVNAELLPTPAVRDTSVQAGHRYWYTVTAVDRAGNESAPSSPAVADVAQPSP
jgi:hypothetical protein